MNLNPKYGRQLGAPGTSFSQDQTSFTSMNQIDCFPLFPPPQVGKSIASKMMTQPCRCPGSPVKEGLWRMIGEKKSLRDGGLFDLCIITITICIITNFFHNVKYTQPPLSPSYYRALATTTAMATSTARKGKATLHYLCTLSLPS